ncbi:MAG: hypothetical protein GX791_03475 [Synergistaceae bacterium]|nr:hypothetical protein [Synergistaceae bacterium]
MKTYTQYLWFERKKQKESGHFRADLFEIFEHSGIRNGMKLVAASHITAGSSPKSWGN